MEGMNYPELVKTVLGRHTENHASKVTEKELIFDCERNSYLVVHVGWESLNSSGKSFGSFSLIKAPI